MLVYNKLVRDRIPQIIEAKGKTGRTRILDEVEYHTQLKLKLSEETTEYLRAENTEEALEELSDILEVVRALAAAHGASWEELEALREQKAEKRGGFEERVFLIDVDEGA
ncbi:nucleoside triphosphate pyrophosphohydrolase [Paenibacillus kobensis]|uniref:nucleoside triphosphate pyrophosphohydrolase n=1 Tax=Paenibacillus kobensis TaxID=59841 RepID=UPI000FDC5FAA|nr:nucleoside triphosphate pyrophosphohydrolase [Paenibacillus kobensis]